MFSDPGQVLAEHFGWDLDDRALEAVDNLAVGVGAFVSGELRDAIQAFGEVDPDDLEHLVNELEANRDADGSADLGPDVTGNLEAEDDPHA